MSSDKARELLERIRDFRYEATSCGTTQLAEFTLSDDDALAAIEAALAETHPVDQAVMRGAAKKIAALSQPETVREAVEALEADLSCHDGGGLPHAADDADLVPVKADALRKALASLSERPDGGWLLIDSAPKDGTHIHVWAPGFEWPEVVQWLNYDEDDAEGIGEPGYWAYAEQLLAEATDSCEPEYWTHWRPLPAPPRSTGEVG